MVKSIDSDAEIIEAHQYLANDYQGWLTSVSQWTIWRGDAERADRVDVAADYDRAIKGTGAIGKLLTAYRNKASVLPDVEEELRNNRWLDFYRARIYILLDHLNGREEVIP